MPPSEVQKIEAGVIGMSVRRVHRLLGIVLLLPICAWVVTGAIFFLKPGYAGAYEMLSVHALSLPAMPAASLPAGAIEARMLRTSIGNHLLVRTAGGWSQYDPATMRVRSMPSPEEVRALVGDAVRGKARYGDLASVRGLTVRTSTGVEIDLDWNTLSLSQHGPDTDRIDLFYRIHYLQWTGIKLLDRILGGAGLVLMLALTLLGLRLVLRR
jgi:uncharacterized iron-regulated membrane protein